MPTVGSWVQPWSLGAIALVGWALERRRLMELVGLLGLDSLKRRRIAAPR